MYYNLDKVDAGCSSVYERKGVAYKLRIAGIASRSVAYISGLAKSLLIVHLYLAEKFLEVIKFHIHTFFFLF